MNRRFLTAFAVVAFGLAAFFYASFFFNLNSTIAEWSGFGINWPVQELHNFLHGRPFQSSLYAAPIGGPAVGFVDNPYAYIHANVIHVNVLPLAFAYLWALRPTVAWLYGIIFLWNLAAAVLFGRLILERLSSADYKPKLLFALAVFFGAGLLSIMDQFAQFLLFVGPFMMAAYYFFVAKRRWWFLACVAAICLVGEDASIMAVTFMGYLFLLEPQAHARSYALLGAAFAVPYTAFVLFVVQPASRAELTVLASSNVANAIAQLRELTADALARNLKSIWPLLTFLPAFPMAGWLFGWPRGRRALQVAGLAVISTSPYWAEMLARGGGHHILPPYVSCYLALLLMLAFGDARGEDWARRPVKPALALTAVVFFLFSFRVQAGLLPNAIRPTLYRLTGKSDKGKALELAMRVEQASNRAVIETARALPAGKSLTYLVNNPATGFILDRSDVWQCHDVLKGRYAFAQTDYFLVQKDGVDLTCCVDVSRGKDLRTIFDKTADDNRINCPMSPAMANMIRDELVGGGTHRIAREDEHVLLLENLHPVHFEVPPTTIGWGWTANLSKKPRRATASAQR